MKMGTQTQEKEIFFAMGYDALKHGAMDAWYMYNTHVLYICGIYTFTSIHLKYIHTPMCYSRPQPVPPKKTYQRWMKLTWATNLCVGVELCYRIPLQLQQLQLCSRPRPPRFRTWGGFLSRNNPTKKSQTFVRFVFGFLFGGSNVWEGIWIDLSSVGAVGAGCCFSSCKKFPPAIARMWIFKTHPGRIFLLEQQLQLLWMKM